jgi:hypothetical protein
LAFEPNGLPGRCHVCAPLVKGAQLEETTYFGRKPSGVSGIVHTLGEYPCQHVSSKSDHLIHWQDDGRPAGFWQDPWWPSKLKTLKKGEQGTFRIESNGIATGVEGWVQFRVELPPVAGEGDQTEFFNLDFRRPYIGSFHKSISVDYRGHDGLT